MCIRDRQGLSLDEALDFFYHSQVYQLIRDGVSDMHCMSDAYLAEELEQEYAGKVPVKMCIRDSMKDAPIVILDEATANVDPENEKELMDAVDALTREKTIIMIAHRLKTVRHADQIVVVDKGKIVQQGTHEQLMKQEGIYKRFVDARQQAVSWKLAR